MSGTVSSVEPQERRLQNDEEHAHTWHACLPTPHALTPRGERQPGRGERGISGVSSSRLEDPPVPEATVMPPGAHRHEHAHTHTHAHAHTASSLGRRAAGEHDVYDAPPESHTGRARCLGLRGGGGAETGAPIEKKEATLLPSPEQLADPLTPPLRALLLEASLSTSPKGGLDQNEPVMLRARELTVAWRAARPELLRVTGALTAAAHGLGAIKRLDAEDEVMSTTARSLWMAAAAGDASDSSRARERLSRWHKTYTRTHTITPQDLARWALETASHLLPRLRAAREAVAHRGRLQAALQAPATDAPPDEGPHATQGARGNRGLTRSRVRLIWANIGTIDLKDIRPEGTTAAARQTDTDDLTAAELQIDATSTMAWGPGPKLADALRRFDDPEVGALMLTEVGHTGLDPLTHEQRYSVILAIFAKRGDCVVFLSKPPAHDTAAGILAAIKPDLLTVIDGSPARFDAPTPGREMYLRVRCSQCALKTELVIGNVYGYQQSYKGPASHPLALHESLKVSAAAYGELLLMGGDFNALHPEDPNVTRAARDTRFAELLDGGLSKLGKRVPTNDYVVRKADEAKGTPEVRGASCIDHVLAGSAAAALAHAPRPTPTLGARPTGHRVLRAVITTYARRDALPAGGGRADRPPRLQRMPKPYSAQERIEWEGEEKKRLAQEGSEGEQPRQPPPRGWDLCNLEAPAAITEALEKFDEQCQKDEAGPAPPGLRLAIACKALTALERDCIEAGETGAAPGGKGGGGRRRKRSDIDTLEAGVQAWQAALDDARQRPPHTAAGVIPHVLRTQARYTRDMHIDQELRLFYSTVPPRMKANARKAAEVRLLQARYAGASEALATAIREGCWSGFKEALDAAAKAGGAGFTAEIFKIFAENAPTDLKSKTAKAGKGSKGVRALLDRTADPPKVVFDEELKEMLAKKGAEAFSDSDLSLRALGHLLEAIGIPRCEDYDGEPPVTLGDRRFDLGTDWRVRERQREKAWQETQLPPSPPPPPLPTPAEGPLTEEDMGEGAGSGELQIARPPATPNPGGDEVAAPATHSPLSSADREWLKGCITELNVESVARRFSATKATASSMFSGYGIKKCPNVTSAFASLLLEATIALDFPQEWYQWVAALAHKGGKKPPLEYKSYRELWVQEHMWTTLLGCIREAWDIPINDRRPWAQGGWAKLRGFTEILLGAKLSMEVAFLSSTYLILSFKDLERFHPMIPQRGRFFLDAWFGVRPCAIRIVARVHLAARGRFKTATGLAPGFDLNRGAGLGCLLAAISSINITTIVVRLNEVTCRGFDLPAPEGFMRSIIADWYGDDEKGKANLIRLAQLQLDGALHGFHLTRQRAGHDEGGEKTAYLNYSLKGTKWESIEEGLLLAAIGTGMADIKLARALLYPYLGNVIADGLGHQQKQDKLETQARALLHLLWRAADGTAHAGDTADALGAIMRGVLDTAAAATPIPEPVTDGLNAAERRTFLKLGHRLPHHLRLAAHAPRDAGGLDLPLLGQWAAAALSGNYLKVLRGRNGDTGKAALESALRMTKMRAGYDALRHHGHVLDYDPPRAALAELNPQLITDKVLLSLASAGLRMRRTATDSQGSLALGATRPPASDPGRAARARGGPVLESLPGVRVPPALRARGVQLLTDIHGHNGELMSNDTFADCFGSVAHPVHAGDLTELADLRRAVEEAPAAIATLAQWERESRPLDPELVHARTFHAHEKARAQGQVPIEKIGWVRTRESDETETFETRLRGAPPRDLREFTEAEVLALASAVGFEELPRGEEAVRRAEKRMEEARRDRWEPRSWNTFLDRHCGGKERGDAFRARMHAPPLTAGTPEANMEATRLLISEYAPRKRHLLPTEFNLKEDREAERRAGWKRPRFQSDFPTEGPKGKAEASLSHTRSAKLAGLAPILTSPAEACARFPEVDWKSAEREPGLIFMGQTDTHAPTLEAMARPELRPFARSRQAESPQATDALACSAPDSYLHSIIQQKEIDSLNNEATLKVLLQVARWSTCRTSELQAQRASRDPAAPPEKPVIVVVGSGDASRGPTALGDSRIGVAVWYGEQPAGSPVPRCLAAALPGECEVADGELYALFKHHLLVEKLLDAGYRVVALYTGDCKAPLDEQEAVLAAGNLRNAKPVAQAHVHERIARIRARAAEEGGCSDAMREPAHRGSYNNFIADAYAKGATHLPISEPVAQSMTHVYRLERRTRGDAVSGTDNWSVVAAGAAKTTRLIRQLLVKEKLHAASEAERRYILTTDERANLAATVGADYRRRLKIIFERHTRAALAAPDATSELRTIVDAINKAWERQWTIMPGTSPLDHAWRAYPILDFTRLQKPSPCAEPEYFTALITGLLNKPGGQGGFTNHLTNSGTWHNCRCGQGIFPPIKDAINGVECLFCDRPGPTDVWHYLISCDAGIDSEVARGISTALLAFLTECYLPPQEPAPFDDLVDDILTTLLVLNSRITEAPTGHESEPAARIAKHCANSILGGMWRRPAPFYMDDRRSHDEPSRASEDEPAPPPRRARVLAAARACCLEIAGLLGDNINSILADGTGGSARRRRKRAQLRDERRLADEDEERRRAQKKEAQAALPWKKRESLAAARRAKTAELREKNNKKREEGFKRQQEENKAKKARPLELTARLGPVMLRRLALAPGRAPPWAPGGMPPLESAAGLDVMDAEDMDASMELRARMALGSSDYGRRKASGKRARPSARARRSSAGAAGTSTELDHDD